jgi:hypothetical protein
MLSLASALTGRTRVFDDAGLGLGLVIYNNGAVAQNVEIKPFIGYAGVKPTLTNGYPVPSGNPARIYIPQITFTPDYATKIISNPSLQIKYNDYYIDKLDRQASPPTGGL